MAASAPFLEARRRIEAVRRSGATALDLSELGLERLPEEVGRLDGLEVLDLGENRLGALPEAIGRLGALRVLNLRGNRLSTLPEAIGGLSRLQELDLGENRLEEVPGAIGRLAGLVSLSLGENRLATLPDAFAGLVALESLNLRSNRLEAVPDWIGRLVGLRRLNLSGNRLAALPRALGRLDRLAELYLHDNPGLGLPPEILGPERSAVAAGVGGRGAVRPADPRAILRYDAERRRQRRRRLNEAKVLIVGQGGVGKTSLARRLISGAFDPGEPKTEGIAIAPWLVEPPEDLRRGPAGEPVQLNVWDFGGQEIMHATHQFFLTRRSLYLLVLDARQGEAEGNVRYWLKIIQSFGADSPAFVVVNKAEAHRLELNETRLAKDHAPNLAGFFNVSCATGEGIDELRSAIVRACCRLPHVFDELPLSYFKVKTSLIAKARKRDFLDYAEYERICKRHGVAGLRDQELLLRFLHDLGNVLNFNDPDDPYGLRETNILNPEWVTGGVYRILNSRSLAAQQGRLEWGQLAGILGDPGAYPPDRHRFLVGMMQKFELCFEYASAPSRRWLVPELLPVNEPGLPDLEEADALRLQYRYNVLPGGLICRFIVRMHEAVAPGESSRWRSGVLLEIDGNRVVVRGDSEAGRVYIAVLGFERRRRAALAVVRDAFRAIHATIPRLEAEEKVPLPDAPGVAVGYRHLLTLEERGIRTVFPEGAGREYEVAELLDGVSTAAEREADRRRSAEVHVRGVFIAYAEHVDMSDPGKHIETRGVTISGPVAGSTINFGAIGGRVSNAIGRLPDGSGPGGEDVKALLIELKAIIERGRAQGVGDQAAGDAMAEVEVIAEGAAEPEAEGMLGRIAKALRNLRRMAPDFQAVPDLARQFGRLLDELGKIWS